MSETIYRECTVFLIFVLYGMVLLASYDLLRCWRRIVRHGNGWISVEDGLFWFAAGLVTFVLIFRYENGALRLYTALAMSCGMLFYSRAVSWLIQKIILGLSHILFRFISLFLKKIDDLWQKAIAKFVRKD